MIRLLLSVSDWSIIMIGPGGSLLVVVPIIMIGPGGSLLVVPIIMIGPGGSVIVVPPFICWSSFSFMGGVAKK